jgi:DNA-binding transcriptional MerR regulator
LTEALTISGLEQKTGVSRSTIHFYIREGLLPQPQKTAATRALYGDAHVKLLRRIVKMKQAGRSLPEIRTALAKELAKARENSVDLAGRESERIRSAILRVATQEFMTKGYKRTHVASIIRKLGITPQVFYSQFPSKRKLLVESFNTFIKWNLAFFEPKLMKSADLGERLLWRVFAHAKANEFGSEVMSLVRSGETGEADLAQSVERAWEGVIRLIVDDFESVRPAGAAPPPVSFELLAYSMIGALHNTVFRASWDDKHDRADILRLHLWTWLALLAAISGEVDIDSRLARYEELVQEMAAREPQAPPVPQE